MEAAHRAHARPDRAVQSIEWAQSGTGHELEQMKQYLVVSERPFTNNIQQVQNPKNVLVIA